MGSLGDGFAKAGIAIVVAGGLIFTAVKYGVIPAVSWVGNSFSEWQEESLSEKEPEPVFTYNGRATIPDSDNREFSFSYTEHPTFEEGKFGIRLRVQNEGSDNYTIVEGLVSTSDMADLREGKRKDFDFVEVTGMTYNLFDGTTDVWNSKNYRVVNYSLESVVDGSFGESKIRLEFEEGRRYFVEALESMVGESSDVDTEKSGNG